MKKRLCYLCCLFTISTVYAQQDKQTTHYMFDRMSYNPAITGFSGFCGTIIYRNQWDRVQDAPNTTLFNIQGNLQNLNSGPGSVGVGISVSNDAIGFQRNNTLTLNGAYHLETNYGMLSGGVGVGMINVAFSPNWVPPLTPADLDPALTSINQVVGETGFDTNFGLYWYGNKDYYVGISTTHIAPAKLSLLKYDVARHYYVLGGYNREIGQSRFNTRYPIYLRPGVLVKSDGATAIFDFNLMANIWVDRESYFWGGVTYRVVDAVALMVGYSITGLKVGYSFDIMTNKLNEYGKGSHELMLNYCIFPPKRGITGGGNPFILR